MILFIKMSCFSLILASFVLNLTVCNIFSENIVTVTGTVIITRKGEPWNPEFLNVLDNSNSQNTIDFDTTRVIARDWQPPPNYQKIYIEKNLAKNDFDLSQGKFSWEINIPARFIPGVIHLEIVVPMANIYPSKTIDIWVENVNSVIDLGVVDFDVVRLWGYLPVTFNGEPLSFFGNNLLNRSMIISISSSDGYSFGNSRYGIEYNGNWVYYIYTQNSETSLTFALEAWHRRGFFKKYLNPDHIITVHNTDKEIIFPDYPYIDFEAFVLKGTVELFLPNSSHLLNSYLNCYFSFYDTEKRHDSRISYFETWAFVENENVFFSWETWIPSFSFPKDLVFELNTTLNYSSRINSSIIITEETNLNDIFLGTFSARPNQ